MASIAIEQSLMSAMISQNNLRLYSFLGGISGNFSEISFVAALGNSFPGGGVFGEERVRRVHFLVQPGDQGGNELVLLQNSIFDLPEQANNPYPIVLAQYLTVFQLDFWDDRQRKFIDEWSGSRTNTLPQIVRMTLGFGSEGRFAKRPTEVITRVIRVPCSVIAGNLQPGGGQPPPGQPGIGRPTPLPRGN